MMKTSVVILILTLLSFSRLSPFLCAESVDSFSLLLSKGNAAYDRGDYQQALENYKQIVDQGLTNGLVFYNFANAHFQLKHLGLAILYYEKALRLLPRDPDVKANLELARAFAQDKIELEGMGTALRIVSYFYRNFTAWELLILTLGFYLLASVFFVIAIVRFASPRRKSFSRIGFLILAPAFVLGFSLLAQLYNATYHPEGVILTTEVNVRSGPGTDFTTLFSIHEGTKVIIRGERSEWVQIVLPNGLSGMIPKENVARI